MYIDTEHPGQRQQERVGGTHQVGSSHDISISIVIFNKVISNYNALKKLCYTPLRRIFTRLHGMLSSHKLRLKTVRNLHGVCIMTLHSLRCVSISLISSVPTLKLLTRDE